MAERLLNEKKRNELIITISIIWIIIFGSIILALKIGLISERQIEIIQASSKDKIDVSGYAEITEKADLAEIYLGVETQDTIASASQKENADIMDKIYKAIYSYVHKEDVETVTFSLETVIDWSDGKQNVVGYKTTHIIKIKASPDDAGKIIDAAVDAGANQINNIVFTLSDSKKEEKGKEALKKAILNARGKAEIVASEIGVKLGKPVYISADYSNVIPYYSSYKSVPEAAGTQISTGDVKVTASVSVSYGFE
jgi:hypothetical protein